MKYSKTIELLKVMLEDYGERVPGITFYNSIGSSMDTSDEPTLKRAVKSMVFLRLIEEDKVNQVVLINPKVKELG